MTTKGKCKITDGPSREELFDALRLRQEHREVTLTWFEGSNSRSASFVVNGIGAEDGSGDNWFLTLSSVEYNPGQTIGGYFNTKVRKGWLSI